MYYLNEYLDHVFAAYLRVLDQVADLASAV